MSSLYVAVLESRYYGTTVIKYFSDRYEVIEARISLYYDDVKKDDTEAVEDIYSLWKRSKQTLLQKICHRLLYKRGEIRFKIQEYLVDDSIKALFELNNDEPKDSFSSKRIH